MRSILSFLFVISLLTFSKAQEKSIFQPKPELKIYYGIPMSFGDNMLNEAHDAKVNFGFWTSPFSIYNFKLGFGFDFTRFDVTDVSLAGNVQESELFNFYGFVAYPFEIFPKFELESKFGIGGNKLRQTTGTERYGNMKGTSFIFGANIEYEFAYPFEVFAGADYTLSKFNVNASQEYEKFFQNTQQLNIFIGLKANLFKRKKSEGG